MEIAQEQALLAAVETEVARIYQEMVDEKFVYHNFQHTVAVVNAAQEILEGYELDAEEKLVVNLACWFHDTGYDQGQRDHEKRSAEYAAAFLKEQGYPEHRIEEVKGCILATKPPQSPNNLLEEIVCDADLAHLGSDTYWDRCGRVRQELVLTRELVMSDQDWVDWELDFVRHHQYKTAVARELFGETKEKHIRTLFKHRLRLNPDLTPGSPKALHEEAFKKKKKKKKKKKTNKNDPNSALKDLNLGRGVETMYRTTYRTHVNLSSIADNKANIMLSINAIIISIVISNLVPRLDGEPELRIPTIMLLLVCLVSLVFAILSTRPKVTEGRFTREDIEQKRSNLLFFGNFYNMNLDDFHWGMLQMIKDSDFLYSSMTRDIYYLGVVLAKKYRYLRICYGVFMYGLIISVIAFAIAQGIQNS